MRDKLGGDIASLQQAGRHEMNDGGRRTAPAVAAEGARQAAATRAKLNRYIEWRQSQEPADTGRASEAEPDQAASAAPPYPVVEHLTGRGKLLRGIVRKDLSYVEAKAIDEYTFKKDGGFFIREKQLESMGVQASEVAPGSASVMGDFLTREIKAFSRRNTKLNASVVLGYLFVRREISRHQ